MIRYSFYLKKKSKRVKELREFLATRLCSLLAISGESHSRILIQNSISYGGASSNGISNLTTRSSSSTMNSSASPFYGRGEADLVDEFQLQDQFSFLNDGPRNSDLYYPPPDLAPNPNASDSYDMNFPYANWVSSTNCLPHQRSCLVSDVSADDPAGGFGWKPCLYFAKGY
ncbi:unnamed protein product [Ilex paraguariensis]|uniref:Uncharacterized protein n=1 Tax=Ilex paraguariensis TaxID=185542 RepID=A0ABC8UDR5_9AQUA